MTSAVAVRQTPWLRYALLGAVLSALWLAISLFSTASGASADAPEPSGLLGTAGALLGGATEVTSTVGDAVGEAVGDAVGEVLPVDETSTDAANGTISGVNTTVATVVNGVTDTLSDVAAGGTVGAVVTPVTGALDGVVDSVPVLGDVLGGDSLGSVVGPLTGAVDGTLAAVVGSTSGLPTDGTGVLPHLPGLPLLPGGSDVPGEPAASGDSGAPGLVTNSPAGTAPHAALSGASERSGFLVDDAASGLAGAVLPGNGGSPLNGFLPPSPAAPAGGAGAGGAAPTGAGGASGTSDAAFAALELDALASLVLHTVDDELPSSVYDTDSTPD
ncbi:hypothetical protein [Agromyces sp. NPDC049794]|uniref:hypothetical protein n=1 Tax=unclassified Agromyces TaxID=2639701 RepID=UPI0033C3596E